MFLEGSFKELLLRRVLRRSLESILVGREALRRILREGGGSHRRRLEGA